MVEWLVATHRQKDYILRLKNASLPELFYRAKQMFLVFGLKRLLGIKKIPVLVPKISYEDVKNLKMPGFNISVPEEMVKRILKGERLTLNAEQKELRNFEREHRHTFFAEIKLSETKVDIRTVWEPGRLQHITMLIAYYLENSEAPEAVDVQQFVKEDVLKWIKDNPFPFGPHYISAMECGLRIPVFFYCLQTLTDLPEREFHLILDAIYLHAWWISKRLSLYASLGNHTICECIGLVFAGAIYKNTPEGKKWLKLGIKLLKQEFEHQILEDGGPAEQSLTYHRFVLDLYWLAVDFLEKNGLYDCRELKPRLLQGENFLNAFQENEDKIPSIGDSDDGYAIAPGIFPQKFVSGLAKEKIKCFQESGYTIIRTPNNVSFTFDHGPLGMAPLYNHGHADALSITLFKQGNGMLVDSGTYRYNGEPDYRRYFKSTRAHNTVTVDGLDQAVQETGFIWSHPYNAKILNRSDHNNAFWIKAVHDGYSRLKQPVIHYRAILFLDDANFLVKDTFSGRGVHDFELNYHLHPDAFVEKKENWWQIDYQETKIFLTLINSYDFRVVTGQVDPLLGWFSPAYGLKVKSSVLSCLKKGLANEVSFKTLICTESPIGGC